MEGIAPRDISTKHPKYLEATKERTEDNRLCPFDGQLCYAPIGSCTKCSYGIQLFTQKALELTTPEQDELIEKKFKSDFTPYDLIGQTFGDLMVCEYVGYSRYNKTTHSNLKHYYICQCNHCGTYFGGITRVSLIQSGNHICPLCQHNKAKVRREEHHGRRTNPTTI